MKRLIVKNLERICTLLDHLRGLGCRLGIANLSLALDDHWETGVWK
jgi:hypothetical protein